MLGSLLMGDLCALTSRVSEGKSRQMFFMSRDERYMVKTVSPAEGQSFLRMLPALLDHAAGHPHTLLSRVLGLYSIQWSEREEPTWFVTMGNVFKNRHRIPISARYDLKGSTRGRTVGARARGRAGLVHKDLDFLHDGGGDGEGAWSGLQKLHLRRGDAAALRRQLAADVAFLKEQHVVDYSLLVGVADCVKVNVEEHRGAFIATYGDTLAGVYADLRDSCVRRGAPHLLEGLTLDEFCRRAFSDTPIAHPGAQRFSQLDGGDDGSPRPASRGRAPPDSPGDGPLTPPMPPLSDDSVQLPEALQLRLNRGADDDGVDFRRGVATAREADTGVSVYGERRLFIGIIDYLVPFDRRKQAEHQAKRILAGGAEDFSVVPPDLYADRFQQFIESVIEPCGEG